MSQQEKQSPRTATAEHSIWRDIPENHFREHLVTLEQRTNAIIVQPQIFSLPEQPSTEARLLPLSIEQSLADDFAYIAAVGEGAQSVSAVCVEEHVSPPSLTLCLASVDAIGEQVQHAFQEILRMLVDSATCLTTSKSAENVGILLRLIVRLHFQKLLGRLRSIKWNKPTYLSQTHKKSLRQDLENLLHRVQHIYPRRKDRTRGVVETHIQSFATCIEEFENTLAGSEDEFICLLKVIEASYSFCYHPQIRDYACRLDRLSNRTPQIAAAIKSLRQVEKIGAYKRIATDLLDVATQHAALFRSLHITYTRPYSAVESEIGYESWARTLHIHAEVQLVVHYDLLSAQPENHSNDSASRHHNPRIIGTSKHLCYLCYMFIRSHGFFIPTNTHGRLYDQWTIPDLVSYNETTLDKYRKIINEMKSSVIEISEQVGPQNGKRDGWRVEPMTSRQNLLVAAIPQPEDRYDLNSLADSLP